ncbi:hypothetical protein HanPI659440_Chr02g0038141 [Helianthus annuus]|nr:hypothetical protein HanPI659440_Chr02g0038141 [Helianthus annuus]
MAFRVTTIDVSAVDLTTRNERRLLMSRTRLPLATFEGYTKRRDWMIILSWLDSYNMLYEAKGLEDYTLALGETLALYIS